MLKVSKTVLLFIAGIVWLAAGVNIARLGILSFGQMSQSMWWMLVIGAIAVFTVFHIKVFSKMVGKHANRIAGYVEDKIAFWRFFDASGYIMMAIMMGGGIGLRMSGLVPEWFIAFFYTGIGFALMMAGVDFVVRYVRTGHQDKCPVVADRG